MMILIHKNKPKINEFNENIEIDIIKKNNLKIDDKGMIMIEIVVLKTIQLLKGIKN